MEWFRLVKKIGLCSDQHRCKHLFPQPLKICSGCVCVCLYIVFFFFHFLWTKLSYTPALSELCGLPIGIVCDDLVCQYFRISVGLVCHVYLLTSIEMIQVEMANTCLHNVNNESGLFDLLLMLSSPQKNGF